MTAALDLAAPFAFLGPAGPVRTPQLQPVVDNDSFLEALELLRDYPELRSSDGVEQTAAQLAEQLLRHYRALPGGHIATRALSIVTDDPFEATNNLIAAARAHVDTLLATHSASTPAVLAAGAEAIAAHLAAQLAAAFEERPWVVRRLLTEQDVASLAKQAETVDHEVVPATALSLDTLLGAEERTELANTLTVLGNWTEVSTCVHNALQDKAHDIILAQEFKYEQAMANSLADAEAIDLA